MSETEFIENLLGQTVHERLRLFIGAMKDLRSTGQPVVPIDNLIRVLVLMAAED